MGMDNDGMHHDAKRGAQKRNPDSLYLRPGRWLPLEECPQSLNQCEALLLCQVSEQEWVAWIPDYGQVPVLF